jgi:hypothetical protein
MNPRVSKVAYAGDHQLLLTFTNNEVKRFDLNNYLQYPVYEPLKDEAFCKKVKVSGGTIEWNDDIDFDPDTLYLEGEPVHSLEER